MSEFLTNFHFLRPWWFVALLPVSLAFVFMLNQYRRQTQWTSLIDNKLLPFLMDGEFSSRQKMPLYGVLVAWVLACIALAGPTWEKQPQPLQKDISALVILWDMSPSMYAQDLKPSRLVRSRLKLVDLLNARQEGLTALIAYAGDAHVVTPLTDDTKTIKSLLPGLTPSIMPAPGSNPERAFALAIELLKETGVAEGTIVFVTDGIPAGAGDTLWAGASESRHRITVWGIGTEEGAPIPLPTGGFAKNKRGEIVIARLEHDALTDMAIRMGGLYVPFAKGNGDLESVNYFAGSEYGKQETQELKVVDQWLEQGHWIAMFLLPFAALAFRRGWVVCLVIGSTLTPAGQAAGWRDLWLTKDQQAQHLLRREDAAAAATTFTDPDWRAIANYKAGQFAAAEQGFSLGEDARSKYNRGNALTHMGDYDGAIKAFDQALALDPELKAAEHNRAIAEQLKELQQQQGKPQQQGEQQQGNQDEQNRADNPQPQSRDASATDPQQKQSEQNRNPQENQHDGERDAARASDPEHMEEAQKQALDEHFQPRDDKAPAEGKEEEWRAERRQSPPREENADPQDPPSMSSVQLSDEEKEQQQALEQWLRKVPDDPSGLLRNKFKFEYQKRRRELQRQPLQDPAASDEERW